MVTEPSTPSAFVELLNSLRLDGFGGGEDRLDDDGWWRSFAARWELDPASDAGRRGELRRLRESLREIVESLPRQGHAITEQQAAFLAGLADTARWSPRVDAATGVTAFVPHGPAWDVMVARTAMSLLDALRRDPRRIKVCSNGACRWAFIDESRNRSRRWCESTACGNVFNVRAYRSRHR